MMATGIRKRHSRSCASRRGGDCSCRPSFEAAVYSRRDRRKIRKTFGTLTAARAWRAEADRAVRRNTLRAPKPTTLDQAAAAWLDGAKAGTIPNRSGDRYKPSTLRGYERALRERILPELGHLRLSDLTRADVQDLADRLTAEGFAASTVQNVLDPLRVICGRALRRDQLSVDPTEGLELRRPRGRRDRIASPAEAAALLDVLSVGDRALWATALYAGLRRGELRALRWDDVDLAAREIDVRRGWDDEEGEIDGKSRAAQRTVPIVDRLARELAAHKLRTGRGGRELVFGRTGDDAFQPATVRRRALAAWSSGGGLEPIRLHEARHTFASLMIAAGVNAKALSVFMGHSSISITFDLYGHLMPDGRDEARERIDRYLATVGGG